MYVTSWQKRTGPEFSQKLGEVHKTHVKARVEAVASLQQDMLSAEEFASLEKAEHLNHYS